MQFTMGHSFKQIFLFLLKLNCLLESCFSSLVHLLLVGCLPAVVARCLCHAAVSVVLMCCHCLTLLVCKMLFF